MPTFKMRRLSIVDLKIQRMLHEIPLLLATSGHFYTPFAYVEDIAAETGNRSERHNLVQSRLTMRD
jgi:hypothetical protein